MSKNKLAKFAEMETFPNVFQCSAEQLRQREMQYEMRGQWKQQFFANDNPIVLELGCGKGEYSVNMAEMFPQKNFIGVDIKGARMWTGAKLSVEKGLKNVAFLRTDIEMLSYFFAQNEVSEIWLTFPDPQMKKAGKRLTSSKFLDIYKKFLKTDGIIHLKTDSNFMYAYTLAIATENNLPLLYSTADLYASKVENPLLNIKTYYECQWLGRGISIKYLSFKLKYLSRFGEPEIEIEKDSYRSFNRN
jgi:tRNA (guanine-N7-)-methyltransferase